AARERFARVASARDALASASGLDVVAGFSVKTNPRRELMTLAREHGFFAETISPDEQAWAAANGFAPEQTIVNGPHPADPPSGEPVAYAFADGLEAFERNLRRGAARVQGVRLRPSLLRSRFGVPVEDDAALAAAASRAPVRAIAISFHARRGDFAGASWNDVANDVLRRAVTLQRETGRTVVAFDVGGGWTPGEFDSAFARETATFAERLAADLPACRTLVVEPGQALCTPVEAVIARVLEVRPRAGRREVIVDAGYPEWPLMHAYVHALWLLRGERWQPLGSGPDRLGGRTCLEYDVLEGVRFPEDVAPGDRLAIGDAGSYDSSMSFRFARGG